MRWVIFLLQFFFLGLGFMQEKSPRIFLIGDSTCADKTIEEYPETGWGTPFASFFDSAFVENHAKNGRSTKSFIEEERWEKVMEQLNPGDYVFIQFGHNDEVPSKVGRYTTPNEFQSNLRKFINGSKSKGAKPVLLTPVTRRSYEAGKLKNTHEAYAKLIREVATQEQIPLIDMTQKSMSLLKDLGEDKSTLLYLHLTPGQHPNYPEGQADNTHFNELGARIMAELVLEGIRENNLSLNQFVRKPK